MAEQKQGNSKGADEHGDIRKLLNETRKILDQQEKSEKQMDEKVNVFSILKLEKTEKAHSRFIRELLNPEGAHSKDNTFLELFLEAVRFEEIKKKELDTSSAWVELEKVIGRRGPTSKTSGRIDIYIEDERENCVSIENKIDALDQDAQLVRYHNYNTEQNTLYYLTLDGKEPSAESRGSLKAGKDYFNISYKEHILPWLESCWKESENQPILHEIIRQYIAVIRRLIVNNENNQQRYNLLLQNYKAAESISKDFSRAQKSFYNDLVKDIIKEFTKMFTHDKYIFEEGKVDGFRIIKITLKRHDKKKTCFAVGDFSLKKDADHLFFGIHGKVKEYQDILKKNGDCGENNWEIGDVWPNFRYFLWGKKNETKSIDEMLSEGLAKKENRDKFINEIVTKVKKYIAI